MKVIFSKYAKQELNDAVHYYELEHEGLGRRLRKRLKRRQSGFLSIPRHGRLSAAMSGNAYSINSHTNCSTQSKKIILL
jgi:hypothetical protein